MRAKTLITVFFITMAFISPANAQDTNLENESESDEFNFAGYVILVVAAFGWTFFLGLLGFGIYLVIRKSRVLYEPKRPPIRCK
tara:strand:+ start:130 stop:381 length:252 start_codon:yes stop_codon:yes gene_type:complete